MPCFLQKGFSEKGTRVYLEMCCIFIDIGGVFLEIENVFLEIGVQHDKGYGPTLPSNWQLKHAQKKINPPVAMHPAKSICRPPLGVLAATPHHHATQAYLAPHHRKRTPQGTTAPRTQAYPGPHHRTTQAYPAPHHRSAQACPTTAPPHLASAPHRTRAPHYRTRQAYPAPHHRTTQAYPRTAPPHLRAVPHFHPSTRA